MANGAKPKDDASPAQADARSSSPGKKSRRNINKSILRRILARANKSYAEKVRKENSAQVTADAKELELTVLEDPDEVSILGMRRLPDSLKPLRTWIRKTCGKDVCVCVRLNVEAQNAKTSDISSCWLVTTNPTNPKLATARNLLEQQGAQKVVVRPTTPHVFKEILERDHRLDENKVKDVVEELLMEALDRGSQATDIHLEDRGNNDIKIRFRINGELKEKKIDKIGTSEMIRSIAHYLFNLAKRGTKQFIPTRPQNASVTMTYPTGDDRVSVDLRIATAPDIRGVDIFVRIARPNALSLEDCKYSEEQQRCLQKAMERPYGVIVFSGPTGSGKSTSLTALLDALPDKDEGGRKIVSLEEPVERELSHVTHVSVSTITEEGGWTSLLGGLNRWDSNINVLGEIKDAATAKAISDLATSGKLTLTTIHASNVFAIPSRMEELGVDHKFLFDKNFLVLLVNQRLVPKICQTCAVTYRDPKKMVDEHVKAMESEGKKVGSDEKAEMEKEVRREMADEMKEIFAVRGLAGIRKVADDEGMGVRVEEGAHNEKGSEEWEKQAERHLRAVSGCSRLLYRRRGEDECRDCEGTGVVGQLLVAEMILMDDVDWKHVQARTWDLWEEGKKKEGNWESIRDRAEEHLRNGHIDAIDVETKVSRLEPKEPKSEEGGVGTGKCPNEPARRDAMQVVA